MHAGRSVTRLTYESYIPLALRTLKQILLDARALPAPSPVTFPGLADAAPCCPPTNAVHNHAHNHSHAHTKSTHGSDVPTLAPTVEVSRIRVAHLLGESPPLTPSIVISVASPHRREAFYVCEWVLEAVKRKAQVWKREWYGPEIDDETATAEQQEPFVGRDGEGPAGRGGRAHEQARWKENFPPVKESSK